MYIRWAVEQDLLEENLHVNILDKYDLDTRVIMCKSIVKTVEHNTLFQSQTSTIDYQQIFFPTKEHVNFALENTGHCLTLPLDISNDGKGTSTYNCSSIMQSCLNVYTYWLTNLEENIPICMKDEQEDFMCRILGHISFLFESRSQLSTLSGKYHSKLSLSSINSNESSRESHLTTSSASFVDIKGQASLCDQAISTFSALIHRKGNTFTKKAWVYILRLILAVTDSVLSPQQEEIGPEKLDLGNIIGVPLLRLLYTTMIKSLQYLTVEESTVWDLLRHFSYRWVHRAGFIEQWNSLNSSVLQAVLLELNTTVNRPKGIESKEAAISLLIFWRGSQTDYIGKGYIPGRHATVNIYSSLDTIQETFFTGRKHISITEVNISRTNLMKIWSFILYSIGNPNRLVNNWNKEPIHPTVHALSIFGIRQLCLMLLYPREYLTEDDSDSDQIVRMPTPSNTIMDIFGNWLFDSAMNTKIEYDRSRYEALMTLGHIFTRGKIQFPIDSDSGINTGLRTALVSSLSESDNDAFPIKMYDDDLFRSRQGQRVNDVHIIRYFQSLKLALEPNSSTQASIAASILYSEQIVSLVEGSEILLPYFNKAIEQIYLDLNAIKKSNKSGEQSISAVSEVPEDVRLRAASLNLIASQVAIVPMKVLHSEKYRDYLGTIKRKSDIEKNTDRFDKDYTQTQQIILMLLTLSLGYEDDPSIQAIILSTTLALMQENKKFVPNFIPLFIAKLFEDNTTWSHQTRKLAVKLFSESASLISRIVEDSSSMEYTSLAEFLKSAVSYVIRQFEQCDQHYGVHVAQETASKNNKTSKSTTNSQISNMWHQKNVMGVVEPLLIEIYKLFIRWVTETQICSTSASIDFLRSELTQVAIRGCRRVYYPPRIQLISERLYHTLSRRIFSANLKNNLNSTSSSLTEDALLLGKKLIANTQTVSDANSTSIEENHVLENGLSYFASNGIIYSCIENNSLDGQNQTDMYIIARDSAEKYVWRIDMPTSGKISRMPQNMSNISSQNTDSQGSTESKNNNQIINNSGKDNQKEREQNEAQSKVDVDIADIEDPLKETIFSCRDNLLSWGACKYAFETDLNGKSKDLDELDPSDVISISERKDLDVYTVRQRVPEEVVVNPCKTLMGLLHDKGDVSLKSEYNLDPIEPEPLTILDPKKTLLQKTRHFFSRFGQFNIQNFKENFHILNHRNLLEKLKALDTIHIKEEQSAAILYTYSKDIQLKDGNMINQLFVTTNKDETSVDFENFLAALGWPIDPRTHLGYLNPYYANRHKENTQQTIRHYYWASEMEEINYILPDCSSHPNNVYLNTGKEILDKDPPSTNSEQVEVHQENEEHYNELDSFPCPVAVIWNDSAYFHDVSTPYFELFKIGKAYCYIIIDPLDFGTFRVRVESSTMLLLLQQRCNVEVSFPNSDIPFLVKSCVSKFHLGDAVRSLIRKITLYINALNYVANSRSLPTDNISFVDQYLIEKMKARITAMEKITNEHTEKQTSSFNYRAINY